MDCDLCLVLLVGFDFPVAQKVFSICPNPCENSKVDTEKDLNKEKKKHFSPPKEKGGPTCVGVARVGGAPSSFGLFIL